MTIPSCRHSEQRGAHYAQRNDGLRRSDPTATAEHRAEGTPIISSATFGEISPFAWADDLEFIRRCDLFLFS